MKPPRTNTGVARTWALMLPSDWWRIPLTDPQTQKQSVKALVQRQFAHDDTNPAIRRRAQADLLGAAAKAAQAGGLMMAVAIMDIAGIPVTATMIVSELPPVFEQIEGIAGLEHRLRNDLMHREGVEEAQIDVGPVLREVTVTDVVRPTSDTEMPQVPELRATYWVFLRDLEQVLHLTFSSPFVPLREGLLPLFDAVVSTLHLPEPVSP